MSIKRNTRTKSSSTALKKKTGSVSVPKAVPKEHHRVLVFLCFVALFFSIAGFLGQHVIAYQLRDQFYLELTEVENRLSGMEEKYRIFKKDVLARLDEASGKIVYPDCYFLGEDWGIYSDMDRKLSLCYQSAWGAPRLKAFPEGDVASADYWHLNFSKQPEDQTMIAYQKLHASVGEDSILFGLCWDCIYPDDLESTKIQLLEHSPDDAIEVSLLRMKDVKGVKVYRTPKEGAEQVEWYFPNVLEEGSYHIYLRGDRSQENQLLLTAGTMLLMNP